MDSFPTGPDPVALVPLTQNGKLTSTVSVGRSRRWTMVLLVVTYFFLVVAPTPLMPLRSIESTTMGGVRKSGSSLTFALITAFPEKVTLSVGAPVSADDSV